MTKLETMIRLANLCEDDSCYDPKARWRAFNQCNEEEGKPLISRDEWEKTEDAKWYHDLYKQAADEKKKILSENPDITDSDIYYFMNLFDSVECDPNKLPENWQEIIKSKAQDQKRDINSDNIPVSGI